MEKICKSCNKTINDGDNFCQECGAKVENESVQNNTITNPQYNQTNTTAGKTNPSAIAGFIFSLLGLLIAGIPMGILAICMGITAQKHITTFKNEKGKGLAIAAIVIGTLDIFFVIFGIILKAVLSAAL